MAIRRTSPIFYHYISHSSRLLTRLFLQPSNAPSTYRKWLWSVQPARLCPLVQLWDIPREELPTGIPETNSPIYSVGIIATPDELSKFGTMMFTDSLVCEVYSKLCYRHSPDAKCYITSERTIQSDFPLTTHGFLDAIFRMLGDADVHDTDDQDPDAGGVTYHLTNVSFEEAISERIRLRGGHFHLVFNKTPVCFTRLQIMRDDEWDFVVRNRAEQQREALLAEED